MPADADAPPDDLDGLYALAPEEFTAARDAQVRALRAGGKRDTAKAVAALRRPTLSAHAVNLLVRAEPDLLAQLLDLGAALAEAQRSGRGADLKTLGAQRRELVEAVADRAEAAAGRDLTAAARGEVTATLEAALADPASAEAVRTGRLVRPLSFAGFGGVDLDGAVADLPAGARAAPVAARKPAGSKQPTGPSPADRAAEKERRAALTAAEAASQQAHGALDDAVRGHEAAQEAAAGAASERQAAHHDVEAARHALEQAQERQAEADRAGRAAEQELKRQARVVQKAQGVAERARSELDRLRRS